MIEHLQLYQNHLLATRHSLATIRAYVGHMRRLNREHPNVYTVTLTDLEEYMAVRRHLSAESLKSIRSAFRSFYSWAERQHLVVHSPAEALERIPIPRVMPRLAPDDQIQLALLTTTDQQRAMVLLGRLACLRLTELTTLHMKHREDDILRVTGKGEKQRLVPINDDLMPVLLKLERTQAYGYYFPGRWGGAMHPQSVNKIITRVTGTNPHSLRHAGATAAYRSTRNLRAVQELLGHASLATTQRYLHTTLDDIRAAAQGTGFSDQWPTTPTTRYAA